MYLREFLEAFARTADGPLRQEGFKKPKPGTYRRSVGERLDVVWLQKHSSKQACCINLGVHYTFIPKGGSMELPADGKIRQPQCELSFRLKEAPEKTDQWWPLSLTDADKVAALVTNRAPTLFRQYALDGEISDLSIEDLRNDRSPLLEPITKVRAALLLARIHEHLGNETRAIDIARYGLQICAERAVGPRVAFKQILKGLDAEP